VADHLIIIIGGGVLALLMAYLAFAPTALPKKQPHSASPVGTPWFSQQLPPSAQIAPNRSEQEPPSPGKKGIAASK
jgi:hypothetical protein